MYQTYLDALRNGRYDVNPLLAHLGIEPIVLEVDRVVLRLKTYEALRQGGGLVAGGVLATLADEAMAHLCLTGLAPQATTVTVEMQIRYFLPVQVGDIIEARAHVVRRGRSLVSLEADLIRVGNEPESAVAKSAATFMVRNR